MEYIYKCEQCNSMIYLEEPIESYQFPVHKNCPNQKLIFIGTENDDTTNLMIEMDLLHEELNNLQVGDVIARLEFGNKEVCLEVNGDDDEKYLEMVDYIMNENGEYVESGFSETIYETPYSSEEVEELFQNWLEQ